MVLLFPALFLFFLFELYPFLYGAYITFSHPEYYQYVLGDPNLILSFKITLLYSFLSIVITFVLGFLFAITFERRLKLKPLYEILFFIPWAIPKYIFILSFRSLLHGYNGDSLFNRLFGTGFNLVDSSFYSWAAIIMVSVILSLPLTTLIIRNALKTTDKELKAVSYIDGVTPLEYYINVALPQIYPTIVPFVVLEFIKSFKAFNIIYLLTQGGPPLLEGFGEKSIIGATTTLTYLSYSMFTEGDDPVIGISYSIIIGIIVLFFLFILFLSYHITRRYKKYKGLFVILPLIFHIIGAISKVGIGTIELIFILIWLPPLYLYIKRNSYFRKVFTYSFLVDFSLNILYMRITDSPFSFSIGSLFTFFMVLFIRPPIMVIGKRREKYGMFYKKIFYWFSIFTVSLFSVLQKKFIYGGIELLISYIFYLKDLLRYLSIAILIFSFLFLNGPLTRIITLIILLGILFEDKLGIKRDNHSVFHLFLSIYLFIVILPIYNILWISLSPKNTLFVNSFFPHPITLANFFSIIYKEKFLLYVKNTLFVAIFTSFLLILSSFGSAYYISRKKNMVGNVLKQSMVYISSFTGIYTLLPLFIVFKSLHLINNIWALAIVFTVNTLPLSIISLEGAISNISFSIEEAASIDGAKTYDILRYLILPLTKSSIVVSGILGFMSAWGGFFAPLIFINDDTKYLISIKLFSYVGEIGSQYPSWTLFSAGAIISAIPAIFLFWITKKFKNI